MFTIFIVDDDFVHLYVTTSDNFSLVLQRLDVIPGRVKFWTIPFEMLVLMWDGKIDYIMREH